ncbi:MULTISPECIES: glutathione S-transferase family protein [Methylobacterium]|jgi:glutathione S-transferase|uniref:Glutathione S-transferase n=2 Tax=Methylobacterium TaxID=407 RepID=A0AAE8L835_9HYPH|nr:MULTISPECIES: glutathione S-transferase family protein [Methylobacterium]KOX45032.1 glutathione S-transferase [Streptomyces purpurogeneiscleroticus]APT32992.1 stress Response [Methylobacterium phyllosphaerae]MBA9064660.1 glutathione S-transferase [Methylobacterium fujisawaense]MBP33394.1 glutathione S-transferase family protein [Methylobacterium sp.]MDE4911201.1 glutathione S-transferase family protein [Methylobacterium sp. 092160098-2]
MITLYHAPQSRSSRMIWLLEELGVPYAIEPVSIFRPMTGEGVPDAANPHPDKRVPALLHNGVLVAESLAIVLHLAEHFPEAGLAPAIGDPDRGAYLTWLAWYVAEFEPALFAGMAGELPGSPQKRRAHEAVVRRLETALARGPYAMGERFSGADILIASALGFGRAAFPASEAFEAYLERCRARPAALRGAARDGASGLQQGA